MSSAGPRILRGLVPWSPLILALGALIVVTLGEHRAGWRHLRAGETTYVMAAESLLLDGDLAFERLDYERHVVTRYGLPSDLALASGTEGRRLTFDASIVPILTTAVGLKLFGEMGFAPLNVLLLAFAAIFTGRRLASKLGRTTPLWLGLLIFASPVFAYVFHGTHDLLLFAAVLMASALLVPGPDSGEGASSRPEGGVPLRLVVAGALLSVAVFSRWQHLLLLLPFAAAASESRSRERAFPALAFGLLAGLTLQALVLFSAGGGLGTFDTVRFVFTPATGFPWVDLPTEHWSHQVAQLKGLHFTGAPRVAWGLQPSVVTWNGLYLFVGQGIGVLTYGLAPLLLLVATGRGRALRGWLLGAMVWAGLTVAMTPFDLHGGAGAIGNRFFLPWLAASVLAWGAPRLRGRGLAAFALSTVALTAPLLAELWRAPAAPPVAESEEGQHFRHVSAVARKLPYEFSQRTLPGGPVLDHHGLRVRLLDADLAETRLDVLTLRGDGMATLWVASPRPLQALRFGFGEDAPSRLELPRGELLDRVLRADGGIDFRLTVPARNHGMWWSPHPQWVYLVSFRLPGAGPEPLELRITSEAAEVGG